MGAGYEGVALDAARARGIALANGAGTNDDCVADHAFGLLIGVVRDIRTLDRLCREGVWREAIPQPPNVSGKTLGILGLGTIGQKIAKRAAASTWRSAITTASRAKACRTATSTA